MRLIYFLVFFLSTALLSEAGAQEVNIGDIYGVWYRSYEDEGKDTIVYHYKGYKFPPIRAREKLEILKPEEIIESRVSPSDAYFKVPGKFSYCKVRNMLIFKFIYEDDIEERKYKIVELNESTLRIKKIDVDKCYKKNKER